MTMARKSKKHINPKSWLVVLSTSLSAAAEQMMPIDVNMRPMIAIAAVVSIFNIYIWMGGSTVSLSQVSDFQALGGQLTCASICAPFSRPVMECRVCDRQSVKCEESSEMRKHPSCKRAQVSTRTFPEKMADWVESLGCEGNRAFQ